LKWEQHTEFVTYTVLLDRISGRPFDPADFEVFPEDWLAEAPGARITSAVIRVEVDNDPEDIREKVRDWFVPESVAVSSMLDGAAVVAGDFRIDSAGHLRFAIFARSSTGARRLGRILQRVCEIETYKSMSMLGFFRVRELSARMGELDSELTKLIGDMTSKRQPPEKTLEALLAASSELEAMAAQMAFRFGATGAYEAIVHERVDVLREERFDGRQTFGEFMMRRYDPAMRTVKSAQGRLDAMSARAIRAGELLRTRVDVDRSAQNQALLESMDKRAALQLRLQNTVEGLSVVAISYYAVSLATYLLYPVSTATGLSKGALTALITLPVVAAVWWLVRRIRARVE